MIYNFASIFWFTSVLYICKYIVLLLNSSSIYWFLILVKMFNPCPLYTWIFVYYIFRNTFIFFRCIILHFLVANLRDVTLDKCAILNFLSHRDTPPSVYFPHSIRLCSQRDNNWVLSTWAAGNEKLSNFSIKTGLPRTLGLFFFLRITIVINSSDFFFYNDKMFSAPQFTLCPWKHL